MNVAVLHFHFRRGGVSSVMQKQVASLGQLSQPPQLCFVVGTPSDAPVPVPVFVVPALDYDSFTGANAQSRRPQAEALALILDRTLREAFPDGCDLIHVHNPMLCKNSSLLGALKLLQDRGYRLLVQIHDVAEDFRPEVYEGHWPYLEGCDYATINQRDRNNLLTAGLRPDQVHNLPNPVTFTDHFSPRVSAEKEVSQGRRTVLYPVRAIRRKNLGEALFLSHFLPPQTEIALTLPPTSPADQLRYEDWKAFGQESGLPIRFEAGVSTSLQTLYDTSFRVVTTSVKEGFGYSYLDPVVQGIPVVGRLLPAVDDFRSQGIPFDRLYGEIRIPRSVLPPQPLHFWLGFALDRLRTAYQPAFPDPVEWERIQTNLASRFTGEFLDFGSLDEDFQRGVLDRMRSDPGFKALLSTENPFLNGFFDDAPTVETALDHRKRILESYSEQNYGRQLLAAYEHALQDSPRGRIDKAVFAACYLQPGAFFGVAS